ncbi:MAG: hypothetical protein F4Y45_01620 [Acidobacteria bacterium]|nr:hypothetical protein [Acidobacteriota bacterium]MYD71086.1 hypothetical protein [Acidobacteriota bacterium]MYJ04314.1 hypothetical protein [Acidobacteriota bacterium]
MRSDYLFATPSTWSGIARLVDLFGVFDSYNDSAADDLADARAIYSDWHIVGQDLADTMMRLESEPTTDQPPIIETARAADGH